MNLPHVLTTLLVFSLGTTLFAQTSAEAFIKDLDKTATLQQKEMGTTGISIAVLSKGKVILKKGYGYADAAAQTSITGDTVFNVGSISKSLAAWGIMTLVQDGKLDLDAPAETYLKSWKLPKTEFDNSKVTIRRMLSHTAGLSVHGYPGFLPEEKRPDLPTSLNGKANGPNATAEVKVILEPATEVKYSGGGFTIMQTIIEDVTGKPYDQYMDEAVFKPMGMNSSAYDLPKHVEKTMATPHSRLGKEIPNRRFTAQAAASLKMSMNDFITFVRANIPKENGGTAGNGVLKWSSIQELWKPSEVRPNVNHGYFNRQTKVGRAYGHGGANYGWHADYMVIPSTGDAIITMTNADSGPPLRNALNCSWMTWLEGTEKECFAPRIEIVLNKHYISDGIKGVFKALEKAKADPALKEQFNENILNRLGYDLMSEHNLDDAVVIFKRNVKEFPKAGNPQDSLGEAYMAQKRYKESIAAYQKSLELDPTNDNATRMIADIKKKMKL